MEINVLSQTGKPKAGQNDCVPQLVRVEQEEQFLGMGWDGRVYLVAVKYIMVSSSIDSGLGVGLWQSYLALVFSF